MSLNKYNYTHLSDEGFLDFAVWIFKKNYAEMEDLLGKRICVRKELERRRLLVKFYTMRASTGK